MMTEIGLDSGALCLPRRDGFTAGAGAVRGWPVPPRQGVGALVRAQLAALGPFGWAGFAISAGILVAVVRELSRLDVRVVSAAIPADPAFWLLFGLSYLVSPTADWIIYRRLWGLPARGFPALLRKTIANNLLVGYVGELYFYLWARRNAQVTAAPFGAVKDVAVLSALAGNAATILLLGFSYPLLAQLSLPWHPRALSLSLGVVVVSSAAILLLRRRLFSIAPVDQRFGLVIHLLRIAASTTLAALVWHTALPGLPFALWFALATLRVVISRLPFLPNHELVLAAVAAVLFGSDQAIAAVIAAVAGLGMLVHITVGLALVAADVLRTRP